MTGSHCIEEGGDLLEKGRKLQERGAEKVAFLTRPTLMRQDASFPQRRSLPSPKRFAQAGRIVQTLNVPRILLEAKNLSAGR
jgi:hypothetical protein